MSIINLARAVDVMFASWFWRKDDVTISALCGMTLRKDPKVRNFNGYLGRLLNRIQANHCELAIADDRARAEAVLKVLS